MIVIVRSGQAARAAVTANILMRPITIAVNALPAGRRAKPPDTIFNDMAVSPNSSQFFAYDCRSGAARDSFGLETGAFDQFLPHRHFARDAGAQLIGAFKFNREARREHTLAHVGLVHDRNDFLGAPVDD